MINLPENNVTMLEVLTNDDDRVTAELHRLPEHEHSQALNHSPTSFFSIAFHLPQWALVYISPQPRTVIYIKETFSTQLNSLLWESPIWPFKISTDCFADPRILVWDSHHPNHSKLLLYVFSCLDVRICKPQSLQLVLWCDWHDWD